MDLGDGTGDLTSDVFGTIAEAQVYCYVVEKYVKRCRSTVHQSHLKGQSIEF